MLKPFYTEEEGGVPNSEYLSIEKNPAKEIEQRLDGAFFYSIVWSVCCTVTGEFRITLNQKFKKILIGDLVKGVKIQNRKLNHPFDKHSIFDCVFFTNENRWKQWVDLIDEKDTVIPKNLQP